MINFDIQTYAPGQVWLFELPPSDVNDDKFRPYLIVGSTNRRITLLKITHGGAYSSNWIQPINVNGNVSNIICDCPISISVHTIEHNCKYLYELSNDAYKYIYCRYLAAMLHVGGMDKLLKNDESVEAINNILDQHEDKYYAFSRYGKIEIADGDDDDIKPDHYLRDGKFNRYDDDSEEDDIEEDAEEAIVDDVIEEEPIEEPVEEPETTDEEDNTEEPEASEEIVEEINEVPEETKKRNYHREKPEIKITDLILFGEGYTSLDQINKVCEKYDIQFPKFQLDDLCHRNKCVFMNGKYNFVLKSNYHRSTKSKKRNFNRVKRVVIDDYDKYGAKVTADIWGTTSSTIYKYVK